MGHVEKGVYIKDEWDDYSALEVLNMIAEKVDIPYELYSALYDKIKYLQPAVKGDVKYYLGYPYDENKHKQIHGPAKVGFTLRTYKVWFDDGGKCIPGAQTYDTYDEAVIGLENWIIRNEEKRKIRAEQRAAKKAEEEAKKAAAQDNSVKQ